MPVPNLAKMPSEHTVENLANHFLLNALASPQAWLFCPTPAEEASKGYDASLQNHKVVILQYKALKNVYINGDLRVNIDAIQRVQLNLTAALINPDIAFYGFCVLPSYGAISGNFLAAPPQTFFEYCIYIKEVDLPSNTTYIRGSMANGFHAYGVGGLIGGPLPFLKGPALSAEIKACRVGAVPTRAFRSERVGSRITSVFFPVPNGKKSKTYSGPA